MPDTQTSTTPTATSTPSPSTAIPAPTPIINEPTATDTTGAAEDTATAESNQATSNATMQEVIDKINDAHNILVALSNDPTVDELSAAIGLSLYLDRTGKRATAIYSGATPNALKFLNPDENLESTTDSLQDFVIALNKDKADHLRYKIDGDYVKVFITPYRTRIAEDDLEFSYGDFNIDLVISLNIKEGAELDSALREYGRIMHDAMIINITTNNPGKFGEIEWANKSASSISEMGATLIFAIATDDFPINGDEATAFLTGIIAATDRFSDGNTTPNTMQIASRLMSAGADQRLINEHVADIGNQPIGDIEPEVKSKTQDPTALKIHHGTEESEDDDEEEETTADDTKDTEKVEDAKEATLTQPAAEPAPSPAAPAPQPEATANAESTPQATAPTADSESTPQSVAPTTPVIPPAPTGNSFAEASFASTGAQSATLSGVEPTAPIWSDNAFIAKPEKIVEPSQAFANEVTTASHSDSLEAALAEISANTPAAPTVSPTEPTEGVISDTPATPVLNNPAASIAPPVPEKPEINGVPEINYTLPADAEVLPPPPVPPINPDAPLPTPTADTTAATPASDNTFQLPNLG